MYKCTPYIDCTVIILSTDPRGNDEREDDVSYNVSGAESGGHRDVTGVSDRRTPHEVDRGHDGVPHADHDDDRHRRNDVDILHRSQRLDSHTTKGVIYGGTRGTNISLFGLDTVPLLLGMKR